MPSFTLLLTWSQGVHAAPLGPLNPGRHPHADSEAKVRTCQEA